jgi:hypothetical protein
VVVVVVVAVVVVVVAVVVAAAGLKGRLVRDEPGTDVWLGPGHQEAADCS